MLMLVCFITFKSLYRRSLNLHILKYRNVPTGMIMAAAITKDMSIMEVVQKYPDTVDVFINSGMGCLGCAAAHFENIEQGAMAHGIDVDALMKGLNEAVGAEA